MFHGAKLKYGKASELRGYLEEVQRVPEGTWFTSRCFFLLALLYSSELQVSVKVSLVWWNLHVKTLGNFGKQFQSHF